MGWGSKDLLSKVFTVKIEKVEGVSGPIIEVSHLHKTFSFLHKKPGLWASCTSLFRPRYKEVVAVDDVSFSIQAGESVAFIGPNGAGKSTLIKMLTGILQPTCGSIRIAGLDPLIDRMRMAMLIGTVFGQKSQLWYHLSPIDTFTLLHRIYELPSLDFKLRLGYLSELFGIEPYLHVPVRKLSLGQRMRCEIVASLLHRPSIIFLDEPTIGLDVIAKQQVRDLLTLLNKQEGITLFLTSHDVGDIEKVTERSIVINQGKLIFDGTADELKKTYITTKIIELIFKEETDTFVCPLGTLLEKTKHSIKIELDTSAQSVEVVLAYALEHFTVLDINILETPLEHIIASLYRGDNHDMVSHS